LADAQFETWLHDFESQTLKKQAEDSWKNQ
jgi:hypothetical protein